MEVLIVKKGQTERIWTPEQKSEIVHKHPDDHISLRALERECTTNRSMICHWVKAYIAEGEAAFVSKGHPGNPFAALHTSNSLPELERLWLIVAKLGIESERLKKGYWEKELGPGAGIGFTPLSLRSIFPIPQIISWGSATRNPQ